MVMDTPTYAKTVDILLVEDSEALSSTSRIWIGLEAGIYAPWGRLTTDSQKSSMDLMISANSSKSTGFVM